MSKSWANGSTPAWRRTRQLILERDSWECQLRIPGTCTLIADCVHHTHGRAHTGDDPAHLIASCTPCNLRVGDPTKKPDPAPLPRTRW